MGNEIMQQPAGLTTSNQANEMASRAIAEVQAAATIAKRFPRDEMAALSKILTSCKRKGLAEAAIYAYPRGGTTVVGPSIRLAEAIAQNWGNLDFGITELERRNGESVVMAYCIDLETNTRQRRVFTVAHERKAKGRIEQLTDPRDIFEMIANLGARWMRQCILAVIPGDILDEALDQCEKTQKLAAGSEPLIDRVRKMVASFAEIGVDQKMIETRLNHKIDVTIEAEVLQLRKIFQSLKDGASKRDDWFKLPQAGGSEANAELEKAGKPEQNASAPPPAEPPPPTKEKVAEKDLLPFEKTKK